MPMKMFIVKVMVTMKIMMMVMVMMLLLLLILKIMMQIMNTMMKMTPPPFNDSTEPNQAGQCAMQFLRSIFYPVCSKTNVPIVTK